MCDLLPFHALDDNELVDLFRTGIPKCDCQADLIFRPLENYILNNSANFSFFSSNMKNCTLQAFNEELTLKQKYLSRGISVVHLNIRSLNSNLEEFQAFVGSLAAPVDVIILSEIWKTNITFYSNILPNYEFITDLPDNSMVGGIGVFTLKSLKVFTRNDLKLNYRAPDLCENIWLEVTKNKSTFLIAGLYRHPRNNIENFSEHFQLNLHKIALSQPNIPCIIATDSNINFLNYEKNSNIKSYIDNLLMHNFFPMILSPTRVTENTSTLIDHIYFYNGNKQAYATTSGNINYEIADHLTNYILVYDNNRGKKFDYQNRPIIRDYKEGYQKQFHNKICNFDWNQMFADCVDVNECFEKFELQLQTIHDETFPLRRISRKELRNADWITPELRAACKKKSQLYRKYNRTKSAYDKKIYLEYKKALSKLCKTKKSNYYSSKLSETTDSKSFWSVINSLFSSKSKPQKGIDKIKIEEIEITDPKIMSDEFNKFFRNIGPALANAIPSGEPFKRFLRASSMNSIFVEPVTELEVITIVNNLKTNKASNDSFLNSKFLKRHINILSFPLSHIFNLSLSSGVVPCKFKCAKVIPIFKKGDQRQITNYRPISLLPTLNKVLEKIVYNRVYNFLSKNEILYKYQFGFRPKHSATMAVLEVADYCYENLGKHQDVLGIYIDLSKAFDTVDHAILLQKLDHCGIRGQLHNWFSSYLCNRKQFCVINEVASSKLTMSHGVPQGSILGPLLFLIYMNDLANVVENLKLFADDTNVFAAGKTPEELETLGNSDLASISQWMKANKMTINLEKTCYTIFYGNRNHRYNINLQIDNHIVKRTSSTKYLGITIDENLNWSEHINNLCNKLLKYVGIFYKIRHYLKIPELVRMYNSLIYPHILYGIETYANTFPSYLSKLNVINNKLLRVIQSKNIRTPIAYLYREVNILPINKLHIFNILLLLHKFKYNKESLPVVFNNYFLSTRDIHSYNSRSININYFIKSVSNEREKRNIKFKAPQLWNSLSTDLKTIQSHTTFKKTLKKFLLSSI